MGDLKKFDSCFGFTMILCMIQLQQAFMALLVGVLELAQTNQKLLDKHFVCQGTTCLSVGHLTQIGEPLRQICC